MILSIFLLVLGFGLLIKGADVMVDGASSIAKKFKISDLVIGLTVVAFGTSAPELVVSLLSAINGNTDIALGNVLGSTIANTLLILGVASLIYPLKVAKNTVFKEIPFSLLAVVLLAIMANDLLIDGIQETIISRSESLVLLSFFIIFMYYTFGIASATPDETEAGEIKERKTLTSIGMVTIGITALVLGGNWVVSSAVSIATSFGLSEALIGFTIVAIGTSLPELVTSAVAARKKQTDIAIGNVIGSNIFNIFWILGITGLIAPLPVNPGTNLDLSVALGATLVLFLALFIGKRHQLERWQGGVFVAVYIIYLTALVIRG
jgi:cation:H+ antiporter